MVLALNVGLSIIHIAVVLTPIMRVFVSEFRNLENEVTLINSISLQLPWIP